MNELDLYQLFGGIISKSQTIRRFVVAPAYGNELNKSNLGEYLKDALDGIDEPQKYPLCMLLPPVELTQGYEGQWTVMKLKLFFLAPQYTNSVGIGYQDNNNLSVHPIWYTWQDMRACAVAFRKALNALTDGSPTMGIHEAQGTELIERYSDVGNDRLAGVSLAFELLLQQDCQQNDYDLDEIKTIVPSLSTIHPKHPF